MPIHPLQYLGRTAKYLLVALVILYASDWAVFEIRLARGAGMASVPVEQYLQTQLKGGKDEYDYLGSTDESCSRTALPQYAASAVNPPCWWLKRHNQRWQ
jgi:hypothetical protein